MDDCFSMPFVQLFLTMQCNLACPYCSQHRNRIHDKQDVFFQTEQFKAVFSKSAPVHFYLSGGEPLMAEGLVDFINDYGKRGHVFSIDTNLSLPENVIRDIFQAIDPAYILGVNVSHHYLCSLSLEEMQVNAQILRERGIKFFVKYVGAPEDLTLIAGYMNHWRKLGMGTAVTVLQGWWGGRAVKCPASYTMAESLQFLDMVTTGAHALQLFDGVYTRGLPCRGGQDFIIWNQNGDGKAACCCHGTDKPIAIENTFFVTGDRQRQPCRVPECLGDVMMMWNVNGLADERERYMAICEGHSPALGIRAALEFVSAIRSKGLELVNEQKYLDVMNAL